MNLRNILFYWRRAESMPEHIREQGFFWNTYVYYLKFGLGY